MDFKEKKEKNAIASRLRTIPHFPALRLAQIISPARRASLFSSARSAEENVCVGLRPSAVKLHFFNFRHFRQFSAL
jgi:hypothetical protein